MKKRRIRLNLLVFAIIFTLTGCGTPLHEMTEDERELVVHYAAYVVAKYNITQTDGYNGTKAEPVDTEEEIIEEPTESETQTPENPEGGAGGETTETDPNVPTANISLAEAIGASELQVDYNGYTIEDSYNESGYYSLSPVAGKKYVVMNFSISNPGTEEKEMDAFSIKPLFSACFNGGDAVPAEETVLTYSLSTYSGTVEPGKSIPVVLLFQVDEGMTNEIGDIRMLFKKDDTLYNVTL